MNKRRRLIDVSFNKNTSYKTADKFCCGHCKTVSNLKNEDEYGTSIFGDVSVSSDTNVCPNCGVKAEPKWLNKYTDTLKNVAVFDNGETVSMSLLFVHPYLDEKNNKLFLSKTSSKRITYNIASGMTYEFPQKTKKGVKVHTLEPNIRNATYGRLEIHRDIINNALVCQAVQSVVAPHIKEQLNLNELKLANRLPQLNAKQLKALAAEISVFKGTRDVFKNTKKNDSIATFLEKVCKNLKVNNNKSIRKLLLDGNFNTIKLAKRYGLKDINHIAQIVQLLNGEVQTTDSVVRNCYLPDLTYNLLGTDEFLADMTQVKGEGATVKVLKSSFCTMEAMYNLLNSSCMWRQVSKYMSASDKKYYLKGNIKDIHDKLSLDINKLKQKGLNAPFVYTDKELELEYSNEEFKFVLAKSKGHMINCGKYMRICVGEEYYTNRAEKKEIYVIIVTDNDDKFKCCIELTNNLGLVQVKTFGNGYAKDSLAEAVREWVRMKGIKNPEACMDYARMGCSPLKNVRANLHQIQVALEAFDAEEDDEDGLPFF